MKGSNSKAAVDLHKKSEERAEQLKVNQILSRSNKRNNLIKYEEISKRKWDVKSQMIPLKVYFGWM